MPDGCYVIGANAAGHIQDYPQDQSAASALFLLSRIESGGNANYGQYLENEKRIDASDVMRMSNLTHALLDNIEYDGIREKRQRNYDYAAQVFEPINQFPHRLLKREDTQVPMVYPLLVEEENLRYILKENHIFVGQWWKYLLNEWKEDVTDFVRYLSRYMIPIQIDQRYGQKEIDCTARLIAKYVK